MLSHPHWIRLIILPFILYLTSACGTNTDDPVYPIFSIVTPTSSPAITKLIPIPAGTTENLLRYEFDVQYFVTNSEENFIGYNLYISSTAVASTGGFVGVSGQPYLETGIEPSFGHKESEASTESSALQTQRIENFQPAPSPVSFQSCEFYFFQITAVFDNGTNSNASPQVQACAASDIATCPQGTPCNP